MDTVSGGETFALYRVRGRCCGREPKIPGTGPPTRLYPQPSLPAHLIQQVQPAEKSQAKSRSPLFLGATL